MLVHERVNVKLFAKVPVSFVPLSQPATRTYRFLTALFKHSLSALSSTAAHLRRYSFIVDGLNPTKHERKVIIPCFLSPAPDAPTCSL